MSHTELATGFMAKLKTPVLDMHEQEDFSERLYDETSGDLKVNYEGTLIYMSKSDAIEDHYGLNFHDISSTSLSSTKLIELCKQYDIEIDETLICPFTSIWYNGAVSYQDMMTLEEFNS